MSQLQRTFSIIKPDAVMRGLTETIQKHLEGEGLRIVAQKKITLEASVAEQFYAEHVDRPFFRDLVGYMTSGEIVVQVLQGDDAIAHHRQVMGATNPEEADPGTLRALYGESRERNSVHGSDSPEAARREIEMFFPGEAAPQSA
ncbi:MAG: nucleoside-diphosphate kinase [Gammaproteobacteria bacterium AqS3]|nr:nucleoside-diphosphate kinase [Gammaproteobacteria bacterium AqS3]